MDTMKIKVLQTKQHNSNRCISDYILRKVFWDWNRSFYSQRFGLLVQSICTPDNIIAFVIILKCKMYHTFFISFFFSVSYFLELQNNLINKNPMIKLTCKCQQFVAKTQPALWDWRTWPCGPTWELPSLVLVDSSLI